MELGLRSGLGVRVRAISFPCSLSHDVYEGRQAYATDSLILKVQSVKEVMTAQNSDLEGTSSATGASRKKEMMVMQENRLMLSSVPCAILTMMNSGVTNDHCERRGSGQA